MTPVSGGALPGPSSKYATGGRGPGDVEAGDEKGASPAPDAEVAVWDFGGGSGAGSGDDGADSSESELQRYEEAERRDGDDPWAGGDDGSEREDEEQERQFDAERARRMDDEYQAMELGEVEVRWQARLAAGAVKPRRFGNVRRMQQKMMLWAAQGGGSAAPAGVKGSAAQALFIPFRLRSLRRWDQLDAQRRLAASQAVDE